MAYIADDGTVRSSPPPTLLRKLNQIPNRWKVMIMMCLVVGWCRFMNPNPLADGRIPAASNYPHDHWKIMSTDDSFVRIMTENLGSSTKKKGEAKVVKKRTEILGDGINDISILMGRVDFGGPDGHVFEAGDWNDIEYTRGTRCSSTQSAVTAYYCGANIAENMDVGMNDKDRKRYYSGVQSFADFIRCRYKQGESNIGGIHRRSVYRLGIGTEDALAGYSHAFSIIAQPDGTFYWLQSFIGHYSLVTWMEKMDAFGKPLGQLTLQELLGKLEQIDRLMRIWNWSTEANTDYFELFNVDMEMTAMKRGKPPVSLTWRPSHRLRAFYWDEACEYPTPASSAQEATTTDKTGTQSPYSFGGGTLLDKCTQQAAAGSLLGALGDLLGALGDSDSPTVEVLPKQQQQEQASLEENEIVIVLDDGSTLAANKVPDILPTETDGAKVIVPDDFLSDSPASQDEAKVIVPDKDGAGVGSLGDGPAPPIIPEKDETIVFHDKDN